MTASVAGLVLAAGEGRRLGRPKALVELDGELLVDRALRTLRDGGCHPVVVVLGAAADEITATAPLSGAVVVVHDDWAQGMASSLRAGLRALSDLAADSVVIALVDQPGVTASLVRRLAAAAPGAVAVAASYAGRRGNPVRLAATIWPEVAALAEADGGARAWLQAHADQVLAVACDDLGHDRDVDTPHDLEHLEEWV